MSETWRRPPMSLPAAALEGHHGILSAPALPRNPLFFGPRNNRVCLVLCQHEVAVLRGAHSVPALGYEDRAARDTSFTQ